MDTLTAYLTTQITAHSAARDQLIAQANAETGTIQAYQDVLARVIAPAPGVDPVDPAYPPEPKGDPA